jgi:L-seryl-tRNA(Ser) seleniumtransferase
MNDLRALPSVEELLQTRQAAELTACHGRPLTVAAVRAVLQQTRAAASQGGPLPDRDHLLAQASVLLSAWTRPSLLPVINATGVILHTNLGRAPLSAAAAAALEAIGRGYSTLEFDLTGGKRGARSIHAGELLTRLTGAEAALMVNNNAAAVLLALSALAARRRVIIARSQLIEIGGGFRIPEVMKQSGARLVEVGTTNKVHLADYEQALQEPAALVLHAHASNFKIIGFTEEPALAEIAAAAHRAGVPCMDDLGSGALLPTERYGLGHEPMVQESLAAGADLVCFSGDKLLGGPQAGILVGRADLITRLKRHPLARAVRADKLCLAALSATLLHYLRDEAENAIPVWRMIAARPADLQARAQAWAQALGQGEVTASESTVGGGSLPGETLPTFVLRLAVQKPDPFLAALRRQSPPVIARAENGGVLLDPRTVLPDQDEALLAALKQALVDAGKLPHPQKDDPR